jgi:hypothetical protein
LADARGAVSSSAAYANNEEDQTRPEHPSEGNTDCKILAACDFRMPRYTPELSAPFAVLSVSSAVFSRLARQALPVTPIRYYFGDDLRWADSNLDRSAWP